MAIHYAISIPNWDSLDSVRWAHSSLELASIVCFGLLALFDILSHLTEENKERARVLERIGLCFFVIAIIAEVAGYVYGQRNDSLAGEQIISLDEIAKDAKGTADAAKTTSGDAKAKVDAIGEKADAIGARIDSATHEMDGMEARLAWRHINPKKRDGYIAQLKPFAGSVVMYDFAGERDPEAIGFATEVLKLLVDSGWTTQNRHNSFGTTTGLLCTTSESSLAGQALAKVIKTLPSSTIRHIDGPIPAGIIVFGMKPPP